MHFIVKATVIRFHYLLDYDRAPGSDKESDRYHENEYG